MPLAKSEEIAMSAAAGAPVRLATRGSPLALLQTRLVGERLGAWEPVVVTTRGDQRRDIPSEEIPGGPGVFTKEVQQAVLDGRADAAVHSAKDLPTTSAPGLVIAAAPDRADPRDALMGCSLADLEPGAVVATDSARRRAQLLHWRPDLRFTLLRGNVETRLAKLDAGEVDAIVLAMAGLLRLGIARPDIHPLEPEEMLPAMGQGTLAVECRDGDAATLARLRAVDDPAVHRTLVAERAAVRTLEGGCQAAIGALVAGGRITVVVASPDGRTLLRDEGPIDEAEAVARRLLTQVGDAGGAWRAS